MAHQALFCRWPMVVIVRGVPWWGVISSAVAPVLLIGGWTAAARLQPRPFNSVTETISALAAQDAADRWLMTFALLGAGACYVTTALALRAAAGPGRLVLIVGGAATVLVAANPEPAGNGSVAHTIWAATAFIAMSIWPALSRGRGFRVAFGLQPAVCAIATAVLLGLLIWFYAELAAGGRQLGLAERVLAGAQVLWPLAVVLSCRWNQSHAQESSAVS
jgi:hypothetical membrane protein